MIEYVYVYYDIILKKYKVPCSRNAKNLPNFKKMGETEESYYQKLRQEEDYLEWLELQKQQEFYYTYLFYDNLLLFVENYEKIAAIKEFYNIKWPRKIFDLDGLNKWLTNGFSLGTVLKILINEPLFSTVCPNCGSKVYIIYFKGTLRYKKHISSFIPKCTKCTTNIDYPHLNRNSFELRDVIFKYPSKQLEGEVFHITQLLDYLNTGKMPSKTHKSYSYDTDIRSSIIPYSQLKIFLKRSKTVVYFDYYFSSIVTKYYLTEQRFLNNEIIVPKKCWTRRFKKAYIKRKYGY